MKRKIGLLMLALWVGALSAQTNEKSAENKKQEIMKEVCNYLKECGVYYLATVEGDQPRVRPFGTSVIFEDKLYIQTGKRKNVSKQMMANPKVEICAYNLSKGTWLRIEATVVPDERIEAKTYMLEQYPSLKRMYAADDDNTQVLYLQNATATFYGFAEEPRVVKF
jgi:uncharacterized pyridoxamine 5'-phosphate oxidase family protein